MKKILLISILLMGCPPEPMPPHPTPVVTDTDWCEAAEVNLKSLGCIPSDKPYTKKGLSFTQFCQKKHDDGVFLNPKCLSNEVTKVTGCEYVDVCTGTKPKDSK